MDDVIISSPSFTQHVKHLKEVFRLLHEAGLTLNKDKCKFGCEELKYLGLIINKEGIKTDETKVQAIVEMKPPPHNSKEVPKFLGMSQWYAKFIKNYADICEPLYNLKRKLKRFIYIWSIEAQKAFDAVKAAIKKAPVLKFPDFKKPFELFTDASSIGVGAVLNQEQRPVVFASRTLSAAEKNYTVTERECLAVVWALNKLRTYLDSLPIKVVTEHAAFTHLTTGRKLITPFQKLVMESDGTEFAVGDIERLFQKARRNTETKHEKWKKYYNRRRRDVQIKVNDWVLVATHPLSLATRKVVAKFKPKFEDPYRVLDVKNNNVVIWKAGKRLTSNVDQVRMYRHRKCDETEIGTGSSDNGNLRDESSGFDRVQRISNDSRDGKKKGVLPRLRKKNRREETVTPPTSGYNIRPRIGKREESRPTIERKTQQVGPVRSRKGRERNYSPYIEERTRSSNKNPRQGGDQQRQNQERRGTCTKKSLSLEVLVGNANYKS
ncbi:retrovirus-related Pol polyprotein from transposon 297 [Trichonephila clavipes]|nr:retrovirus-related Pol polyprotein from transposon 297 [Trichonephila clavipes]